MRGTTEWADKHRWLVSISIHVPREGDDAVGFMIAVDAGKISIHVPREGDDIVFDDILFDKEISIHVPREGDDARSLGSLFATGLFQSTSPVRGTTTAARAALLDF